MKKSLMLLLSGLILLTAAISAGTLVQEEEEPEYSWGTVTSISSGKIVIAEYDYDIDEEVDVVYILNSDVKLEKIKSLKDIAVGDDIWVEYVSKDDKKVAVSLELR